MRVLQVVTDTDRRGAQVFATDLEQALAERGHAVETVALKPGNSGGLEVEALASSWPATKTLTALRERMATVDITTAHGSATGPACALAGLGGRHPFIYRQVSDSNFWAPTITKRTRTRVILSQARAVVALSEFNRGQLIDRIGVKASQIVVIPNGVPATEFSPASPNDRAAARSALGLPDVATVLFVGALVPEKGADLAIWCLRALPDVHLVVAGAGAEQAQLEQLATKLAPGRVHFVGARTAAAPLYHASDLLVLPSRGGDAMPAVLLEAGLSGLPVVSTRIGAIPEVVVDGVTGFVVAPDDLTALKAAIDTLLSDPDTRATMGDAARTRCLDRYEIGRVAEQWESVLVRASGVA